MAETTGFILKHGHVLVEIQELAQNTHSLITVALNGWWLTCERQRSQCAPFSDRFIFYETNFTADPFYFLRQIGWQDTRRVWVIKRRRWRWRLLPLVVLRRYGPSGNQQAGRDHR